MHQRLLFMTNCCFRFRRFSVSKDDFKVLDEDTPGGGLVAEFCHMVGN